MYFLLLRFNTMLMIFFLQKKFIRDSVSFRLPVATLLICLASFLSTNLEAQGSSGITTQSISADSLLSSMQQQFLTTAAHWAKYPQSRLLSAYIDSLSCLPGYRFFNTVDVAGPLVGRQVHVAAELRKAFAALPQQFKSRTDSLSAVVNLVYSLVIQGTGGKDLPELTVDSLATLFSKGLLWGDCGLSTAYLSQIIKQYFAYWGSAVKLFATADRFYAPGNICNFSHVMIGLTRQDGRIYAMLDPLDNVLWVDRYTGKLLSLDSAMVFLRDEKKAGRVQTKSSNFFSKYHCQYAEGPVPIVFSEDVLPLDSLKIKAFKVGDHFVLKGPFRNFDYHDPVWGHPVQDYYWKKMGLPRAYWGFRNVLLIIWRVDGDNKDILSKVAERYHLARY